MRTYDPWHFREPEGLPGCDVPNDYYILKIRGVTIWISI
jgi:hypothetical protein